MKVVTLEIKEDQINAMKWLLERGMELTTSDTRLDLYADLKWELEKDKD